MERERRVIRATAAARLSAPAPPSATHIWLTGNSGVTANVFANAGEEACAVALEGLGHNVTRYQSSTISTAPLATDCDLVVHLDGTVSGTSTLRAVAANAAPVIGCNPYYNANSSGHTALVTGAAGTDASDDEWQVLNLAPGWTAGYAINDTVAIAGFSVYQERIWNVVSGGLAFARTPAANHNVCWGFPVGTTNLASEVTTARVVLTSVFTGIQHLNAAGLQILDDLIAWAAA